MVTGNQINEMRIEDDSPEKAGVGGSIPSLATIPNLPCFKRLHTFVSMAMRCESGSVESIWSPNSSRLRSW
jgi:hypothetical protein